MNKYAEEFERNKEIIIKYLFEDMTLRELGGIYGISHERVRQILEIYGVTMKPQNKLRIRMMRLYDFLIQYKSENDGNTPGKTAMRDGAQLSTTTRVEGALVALEREGLINFTRYVGNKKSKISVQIVGARWIPPMG